MPWVRLSDDWYDDPELVAAGPLAMMVWPLLISWSARNLQDGLVPSGQVRRLVDWSSLGVDPEQAIAQLVACGRLQEIAGGHLIVNFLKYQPSREKVLKDRGDARGRAAKSRDRAKGVRETCGDGADPPVPVPVPVPDTSHLPSTSDLSSLPDDLWTTMASKKVGTAKNVTNAKGYQRKCIENDRKDPELVARAIQLTEMFDLTTSYLAECLISGSTPSAAYRKQPAA